MLGPDCEIRVQHPRQGEFQHNQQCHDQRASAKRARQVVFEGEYFRGSWQCDKTEWGNLRQSYPYRYRKCYLQRRPARLCFMERKHFTVTQSASPADHRQTSVKWYAVQGVGIESAKKHFAGVWIWDKRWPQTNEPDRRGFLPSDRAEPVSRCWSCVKYKLHPRDGANQQNFLHSKLSRQPQV